MAASTRTSIRISSWPPTRSKVRSCSARSELDLELRRHVADLVEEDAAPMGQLELSQSALLGVGEGALLVAEELGLAGAARDGGGGDAHEGPPRPAAVVVERARHHLLAGAGLAAEQHAHVAGGHAADGLVHLLHGGMPPHEGAELPHLPEPGAERRHLLGEPPRGQRPLAEEQRLVDVEGLGEIVVGALLHGRDGRLHGAVGGHDHHEGVGARARGAGAGG